MMLKTLIETLEKADPDYVCPIGFAGPHSYRGYYECLAFEPRGNIRVRDMLHLARECLGETFQGYKGGDYKMGEYTDVYLAFYGRSGEELGPLLLSYMLGDPKLPTDD